MVTRDSFVIRKNKKDYPKVIWMLVGISLVLLVLFQGPAQAFNLGLQEFSDTTPGKGENISTIASIDITATERVNLDFLVLNITSSTNQNCKFYPNASIISGCGGIGITLLSDNSTFGTGYGYSYGQSYSYGYDDYGYGYYLGYNGGTLTYNITLDTLYFIPQSYDLKLSTSINQTKFNSASESITINSSSLSSLVKRYYSGDNADIDSGFGLILDLNSNSSGNISLVNYSANIIEAVPSTKISFEKFYEIDADSELRQNMGWVKINVSYLDSELSLYELDESSLRLYYYNISAEAWEMYDGVYGGVDTVNNIVWARTDYFGIFGVFGSEAANIVQITYPINTTYSTNISELNYTFAKYNDSCWYSDSNGVLNSSKVAAGINFTNVISVNGSNTWTVYCNDSFGNLSSSSVTFNKLGSRLGLELLYPLTNVNVSQNGFFNVSANVSCISGNCGETNVSLVSGRDSSSVLCLNDASGNNCLGNLDLSSTNLCGYGYNWADAYQVNSNVSATSIANVTLTMWHTECDINDIGFYLNDVLVYTYDNPIVDCSCSPNPLKWSTTVVLNSSQIAVFSENWNVNGNNTLKINKSGTLYNSLSYVNITYGNSISSVIGSNPFYTTLTNPYNLTLNGGESQIITWLVNATGEINFPHEFYIYANSTSGLTNQTSSWNVTIIDTTNPLVEITSPVNETAYNINVSELNYTYSDINSGYCWYSNDSGNTNSTSVVAGTNFTNLISNEGNNAWTVYCNDSSGNINSSSITFFKDTISPEVSLVYPANVSYNINVSSLNYTYSDTNPAGYCWYSNSSGEWNSTSVVAGINFTNTTTSNQGNNTWTVYCNDSLGNENSSSITFFKDTINPNVNIVYPTNTVYTTAVSTLNYTVNDTNLDSCRYSLNNGVTIANLTCGANLTGLSPIEGSNTWIVYANDSSGNEASFSVTFTMDLIADSSSGGGSGDFCTYRSTYNWSCSNWSPCVNGKQTRVCNQKNNCGTTFGRPETNRTCNANVTNPSQLFDIKLELENSLVDDSGKLASAIRFESFGNVPTQVNITYRIFDSNGKEVYFEEQSIMVTTEEIVIKNFDGLNLPAGDYTLVVTTSYGSNVTDEFKQTFKVKSATGEIKKTNWTLIIVLIVGVIAIAIVSLIIRIKRIKAEKKYLRHLR
jgi:hypothetical protein